MEDTKPTQANEIFCEGVVGRVFAQVLDLQTHESTDDNQAKAKGGAITEYIVETIPPGLGTSDCEQR